MTHLRKAAAALFALAVVFLIVGRSKQVVVSERTIPTDSNSEATSASAGPYTTPLPRNVVSPLSSSKPPLPMAGMPLKNTMQSLWELAQSGDASAASRLTAEMSRCAERRSALRTAKYITDPANKTSNEFQDESSAQLAEEQIVRTQARFARASAASALCDGLGDEVLDGRLFRYAVVAATLGDAKAATCVVEGVFIPGDTTPDSEFWDVYRAAAPVIAEQQLEAANATMVQQLIEVYDPSVASTYSFLELANPQRAYMYTQLLAHIATNDALADIGSRATRLVGQLSPVQKKQAEIEANLLYERYFHGIKHEVDFQRSFAVCSNGYLDG